MRIYCTKRAERSGVGAAFLALILACGCTLSLSSAEKAHAEDKPAAIAKGGHGFDAFCAKVMAKLHKREKQAVRSMSIQKTGGSFAGEYKGYSASHSKCEARPTGSDARPFVGQLVYHEIQYRKSGSTQKAAKKSKPQAVSRMEVMEIFSHDGKEWTY